MEAMISNLLARFERGSLSRRDLVQGLTALAATGGAVSAQAQDSGLKSVKIDHVSIQVSDLPGSIAFYQKMFGLTTIGEDKPNEIVRLGANGKVLVSLHHKAPYAVVDHFAIGVEKFNKDAMTKQLKDRGADPSDNLDAGFHIVDPSGISVQVMGA